MFEGIKLEEKEFLRRIRKSGSDHDYNHAKRYVGKNMEIRICASCDKKFEVDKFIESELEKKFTHCEECFNELKGQLEYIEDQMYPDESIETNDPDDY